MFLYRLSLMIFGENYLNHSHDDYVICMFHIYFITMATVSNIFVNNISFIWILNRILVLKLYYIFYIIMIIFFLYFITILLKLSYTISMNNQQHTYIPILKIKLEIVNYYRTTIWPVLISLRYYTNV